MSSSGQDTIADSGHNKVSLNAPRDSTITNVNLYSGFAEINRTFRFAVKAGMNMVTITTLPKALQEDSVRVEGRGNATIHDVILSETYLPLDSGPTLSAAERDDLLHKCIEVDDDLASARHARSTLDSYLSSTDATNCDPAKLQKCLETFLHLARKTDMRITELINKRTELNKQLGGDNKDTQRRTPAWQAVVHVHARKEEEVKIKFTYAVQSSRGSAEWSASYDIRADTYSKTPNKVTVLYKATITQTTGEDWENVPLTLDTTTPSYGVGIPELSSWRIGVPSERPRYRARARAHRRYSHSPDSSDRCRREASSARRRSRSRSPRAEIVHQTAEVVNKGGIVATFRVPGSINIPSDGKRHNVVIAQLTLDADLSWVAVPALDTRAHIKAKIKNTSEYPFIPGPANIYMDGSFIATTRIPPISPEEIFDCPLGVDTSLRITYHPREKKAAQSGFFAFTNTSTQCYTQRITIANNKSTTTVNNLRVIDRVPISEDQRIEVKLINPPLVTPPTNVPAPPQSPNTPSGGSASNAIKKGLNPLQLTKTMSKPDQNQIPGPVRISNKVLAQWDGADDPKVDYFAAAKSGKFNWLVSIPPQSNVTLVLQCEVNYPQNLTVDGLL